MSALRTLDTQGAVPVRIACVTALRPGNFCGTRIGPPGSLVPQSLLGGYTHMLELLKYRYLFKLQLFCAEL